MTTQYVWGFLVREKEDDYELSEPVDPNPKHLRHLIAKDAEEALSKAIQFIKEDNGEAWHEYEIVYLIRKMNLSQPDPLET